MNTHHFPSLAFLLALIFPVLAPAQQLVKGYILEKGSGEALSFAQVYDSISQQGTLTDREGQFFFSTGKDSLSLSIYHFSSGHAFFKGKVGTELLIIELSPFATDTVNLTAFQSASQSMVGRISFSDRQIREMPALGGEADLVKALTLLPGVSPGREGSAELNVRGGSRGQNLFLLDGIPMYNTGHLLNLFSVFNPDAVKQVDFFGSSFPIQYGGRISSIVDISFREGNQKKYTGKVELGVISSKVLLEGPIGKKTNFLISARTTYLELFNQKKRRALRRFSVPPAFRMTNLGFTDVNLKVSHRPNDKHKISLTGFAGWDRFQVYEAGEDFRQTLQNANLNLTHHWTPSSRFYLRTSLYSVNSLAGLTRTELDYTIRDTTTSPTQPSFFVADTNAVSIYQAENGIRDQGFLTLAKLIGKEWGSLNFGAQVVRHHYQLGDYLIQNKILNPEEVLEESYTEPYLSGVEFAGFLGYEKQFGNFGFNAGLRWAGFVSRLGSFRHLLPRLSLSKKLGRNMSLQVAYDQTVQYQHLWVRPVQVVNQNIWLPTSDSLPPQLGQQLTVGLGNIQLGKSLQLSVSLYGKQMQDQLIYQFDLGDNFWAKDWEEKFFTSGEGRAAGLEFFLSFYLKKWEGSLSYSLSRSQRRFGEINNGEWFFHDFDRLHQINLFFSRQLNARYKFTGLWVLSNGHRFNLPTQYIPGNPYSFGHFAFEGFNESQLPFYHRLDLSLHYVYSTPLGNEIGVSLGIYNAYFNFNAYTLQGKVVLQNNPSTGLSSFIPSIRGIALFPPIPSLNIRYAF